MIFSIKSLLKKSVFWKIIENSDFYQKRNYPERYNQYKEELNFYKDFLKLHPASNDLIFDVGANKGHKSFIFSNLVKRVVAFEPSESLNAKLFERFRNSNVEVRTCALGSKTSTAELLIVENNQAYNSLSKKHMETTVVNRKITSSSKIYSEKVELRMLEEFIEEYGIPKYIKIDVEGYEYEVLEGLSEAVPLISFEANMPEFTKEAISSIKRLQAISGNRYSFNFSTGNSFINENFVSGMEAIDFLHDCKLKYAEVYAVHGQPIYKA